MSTRELLERAGKEEQAQNPPRGGKRVGNVLSRRSAVTGIIGGRSRVAKPYQGGERRKTSRGNWAETGLVVKRPNRKLDKERKGKTLWP